jgi:DNA-binding transcriptional ArsR family regulator
MLSKPVIEHAGAAATLLSLLGNKKRLIIVSHLLSRGEMSVGAIADHVGLSQSALSQHLAKLRGAGLVETRRDKQTIYYSCDSNAVRRLLSTLDAIFNEADGQMPAAPMFLEESRLRQGDLKT